MDEKVCPSCGESAHRRKSVGNKMVCPNCFIEVELLEGEWVTKGTVPPTKELIQILITNLREREDNIFPYVIPEHKKIRTRKILKDSWFKNYPIMERMGLDKSQALECYDLAIRELLRRKNETELGLVLWFISSKDSNFFQKVLTKHVKSIERLNTLSAEEDHWLE